MERKTIIASPINALSSIIGIFIISLTLAISPAFFAKLQLPPCILKTIFAINCPFCGMTRDFILMANGSFPHHNPFSALFALIIFIIYPLTLGFCILRKQETKIEYLRIRNVFILTMMTMLIVNNLK